MISLLKLDGVTARYGGVVALNKISTFVEKGKIHGLIGPNGAGKTTLFNIISGLTRATEGSVQYKGEDITHVATHVRAQNGIQRTFQSVQLWQDRTVLENVLAGAAAAFARRSLLKRVGLPKARKFTERDAERRALEVLDFVGISARPFTELASLPFVEQRFIEIARALVSEPDLLLLDEPAAGLSPSEVEKLMQLIRTVASEWKIGIVLVEHLISLIMSVCDRITVLNNGLLIAEGNAQDISSNPEVRRAYLGRA